MSLFKCSPFFQTQWDEHIQVAQAVQNQLASAFEAWVACCAQALQQGNKLLFFGNGGSAADAQHLATEFTVRYTKDRRALAALALTTDTSTLTAIGNDLGFDKLFSRQIEALGRPGDVAIGITTSGKSANITQGLQTARTCGLIPTALCAGSGGNLVGLADPLICVPSTTTSRIQEMHIALGQMLCGALEGTLDVYTERRMS